MFKCEISTPGADGHFMPAQAGPVYWGRLIASLVSPPSSRPFLAPPLLPHRPRPSKKCRSCFVQFNPWCSSCCTQFSPCCSKSATCISLRTVRCYCSHFLLPGQQWKKKTKVQMGGSKPKFINSFCSFNEFNTFSNATSQYFWMLQTISTFQVVEIGVEMKCRKTL